MCPTKEESVIELEVKGHCGVHRCFKLHIKELMSLSLLGTFKFIQFRNQEKYTHRMHGMLASSVVRNVV